MAEGLATDGPKSVNLTSPPDRYTVISKISGVDTGFKLTYVRNAGNKRLDIRKFTRDAIGFVFDVHEGYLFDKGKAASIDYRRDIITNPMADRYSKPQARGEGSPNLQFGLDSYLFGPVSKTDRRAEIAGYECTYWRYEMHDAEECVTQWGASLHTILKFPGDIGSVEFIATKVLIDDGGPDSAFDFKRFKVIGKK
ncbi:hypothetical protein [Hyphococcus luteus]|uniref:hypothetical protein n=1 Tax=Hyphococcus luteus TaxID=2058213 RepID=UPI00105738F2|nr:hypothetical protein [Marinicaulis flavus]